VGIARSALHKVLGDRAIASGAEVRLGVTVDDLADDGADVTASFSNGGVARYDVVIGADGVHSQTRAMLFPRWAGARLHRPVGMAIQSSPAGRSRCASCL
jgi:2-polyprenyl-6-methoxyphenol hydroxylase-like FAD-dependent oxidoreductase